MMSGERLRVAVGRDGDDQQHRVGLARSSVVAAPYRGLRRSASAIPPGRHSRCRSWTAALAPPTAGVAEVGRIGGQQEETRRRKQAGENAPEQRSAAERFLLAPRLPKHSCPGIPEGETLIGAARLLPAFGADRPAREQRGLDDARDLAEGAARPCRQGRRIGDVARRSATAAGSRAGARQCRRRCGEAGDGRLRHSRRARQAHRLPTAGSGPRLRRGAMPLPPRSSLPCAATAGARQRLSPQARSAAG